MHTSSEDTYRREYSRR